MTLPTTCGVVIGGALSGALAFTDVCVAAGAVAVFAGPPPTTYTVDETTGSQDHVPDVSEELSDTVKVTDDDGDDVDVD